MVSKKHGKIIKVKNIYHEDYGEYDNPDIDFCHAEDGSKFIRVYIPIGEVVIKRGWSQYLPTYDGMRGIIRGLVAAEAINLGITVKEAVKVVEEGLNIIAK